MNYKVFLGVVALMGASVYGSAAQAPASGGGVVTQAPVSGGSIFGSLFGAKKDAPAPVVPQAQTPVPSVGGVVSGQPGVAVDPKLSAPVSAPAANKAECQKWVESKVPVDGSVFALARLMKHKDDCAMIVTQIPEVVGAIEKAKTQPVNDDVPACNYSAPFSSKVDNVTHAIKNACKNFAKLAKVQKATVAGIAAQQQQELRAAQAAALKAQMDAKAASIAAIKAPVVQGPPAAQGNGSMPLVSQKVPGAQVGASVAQQGAPVGGQVPPVVDPKATATNKVLPGAQPVNF